MNKSEARIYSLDLRKKEDSNISSKNVIKQIVDSNILSNFSNIGIYYPLGNEISIIDLLDIYPNKKFYLPITRDRLYFIEYNKNDSLVNAKFHTKEPKGKIVKRDEIDCFIIPCVGISYEMKRIGYGKGYYDKYLSNYKGYKIGITYNSSFNLDVLLDDYDLKLDLVFKG